MSTNFMSISILTQNTMPHALSTKFHESANVTGLLHLHDYASSKNHFTDSTYPQSNLAMLSPSFLINGLKGMYSLA